MHLVIVANEFVEAVLHRVAGGSVVAQAPLAEAASAITGLLQPLDQRHVASLNGRGARVGANRPMAVMQTSHQRAARRGANRATGVTLREARSFGGDAVSIGRLDHSLAVTAKVAVTEVVKQDENNIRALGLGVDGD